MLYFNTRKCGEKMTGLGCEVCSGLPANVDSSVSLSGPPSPLCVQKLPYISFWG